jgi:hypothetical protein
MDRISKQEIEKWRSKINEVINEIKPVDKKSEEMLKNMKAYVSDSNFFEEKGDLVRSFESILWAWAIFEICQELKLFKR